MDRQFSLRNVAEISLQTDRVGSFMGILWAMPYKSKIAISAREFFRHNLRILARTTLFVVRARIDRTGQLKENCVISGPFTAAFQTAR